MFAAHNMNVINCSVWCCCCHHQHHHYAIGGAIAIVDVTAVFQTKLIFKHYDLNVRISILPEIKLHIFKREKKGEKGAELLCKQWNSHVFFSFSISRCRFLFLFCFVCAPSGVDSCEAFAYIHHQYHHYGGVCAQCAYLWYKKNANKIEV